MIDHVTEWAFQVLRQLQVISVISKYKGEAQTTEFLFGLGLVNNPQLL